MVLVIIIFIPEGFSESPFGAIKTRKYIWEGERHEKMKKYIGGRRWRVRKPREREREKRERKKRERERETERACGGERRGEREVACLRR